MERAPAMPAGSSGLVLAREAAVRFADQRRAEGKIVVFTNGCYDLLHLGHVRLLEAARAEGDLLFVAVNDDASVRRLKGAPRPLTPLEDRLGILAALRAVDVVFPFSEDTPWESIRLIRPQVLVKGADWGEDEIVGADLVRESWGRVVRIPLVEDRSSSRIVRLIKELDGGTP